MPAFGIGTPCKFFAIYSDDGTFKIELATYGNFAKDNPKAFEVDLKDPTIGFSHKCQTHMWNVKEGKWTYKLKLPAGGH